MQLGRYAIHRWANSPDKGKKTLLAAETAQATEKYATAGNAITYTGRPMGKITLTPR